ncbi:hypothetical protein ACP70R_022397 [Stipagrostis hirtigluma subsp. patula]
MWNSWLHFCTSKDLEPSDEPNAKICEVPCLTFFHATREADNYSGCSTVSVTTAQVEAMQHFFCTNCIKKATPVCLLCGVGIFRCDQCSGVCSHVNCGRFYPEDHVDAARCGDQVAAGVVFECRRPHRAGYDFE